MPLILQLKEKKKEKKIAITQQVYTLFPISMVILKELFSSYQKTCVQTAGHTLTACGLFEKGTRRRRIGFQVPYSVEIAFVIACRQRGS